MGASPIEPRDLLDYLPHSTILSYDTGEVIYDPQQCSAHLWLVIEGRVRVSRMEGGDSQASLEVRENEEIFGESALLGPSSHPEWAITLEPSRLMAWTADELNRIILRRPQVGMALGQVLAKRLIDLGNRIERVAADKISHRNGV